MSALSWVLEIEGQLVVVNWQVLVGNLLFRYVFGTHFQSRSTRSRYRLLSRIHAYLLSQYSPRELVSDEDDRMIFESIGGHQ